MGCCQVTTLGKLFTYICKQYYLVLAKKYRCSAAGKVTVSLAEINVSLPLVLCLSYVTCLLCSGSSACIGFYTTLSFPFVVALDSSFIIHYKISIKSE